VSEARVCAGLQTGAGHELLFLDDARVHVSPAAAATAAPGCPAAPKFDYSTLPSW
jgi:hypothetical protein